MGAKFFCREAGVDLWLETCFRCKTRFAMSDAIHAVALDRRESFQFYCPSGHSQVYVSGETEADKLRRERDRLKQDQAWYESRLKEERAMREAAEKTASVRKGQVTRLKNRAAAGVCPCCNRTVSQMARHMASKHPGFKAEEVA
jgi:hypothetical protein